MQLTKSSLFHALLLLTSTLILNACDSPAQDTLRFGLSSAPRKLDPTLATDAASERINQLIYRSLVRLDEQSRPQPELASWAQPDSRTYRFTLKQDLPDFHHGKPLTSADIKATFDRLLDPATASPHRGALKHIERITTPDARTVEFHLSRADPLLPMQLGIGILPADLVAQGHDFIRHPVGNGPLRFQAWPRDGLLQLQRIADQQRIEFVHVPDATMRVLKLRQGEIDIVQNDLLPELWEYLRELPGVEVREHPGITFAYIGFNLESGPTAELKVRQATALAIDRAAIIEHLFKGRARLAASILPPEHWAGLPNPRQIAFDPERARRLLAELGYGPDKPLDLTFKTSTDAFRLRLIQVVQQQLAEVGIRLKIQSLDWGTFFGDVKAGRFQLYSLAWVGVRSPDIFRYVFSSESLPPNGANRGRYRSAEVDRLINVAETASVRSMRVAKYRELQELLLRDMPYVPLWYEHNLAAVRSKAAAYRLDGGGSYRALGGTRRSD